jgi:hypothetical protein
MKRLRVELFCERSDLIFVDLMCVADKPLCDAQVFEVESRLFGGRIQVRQDWSLLQSQRSRNGYFPAVAFR